MKQFIPNVVYRDEINHESNTIHTQMQTQGDSVVSGTNGFINFWLRFFDMRRETQFWKVYADHTMLTPLCWRAAHLGMFKISVGRDKKNSTTSSTAQVLLSPQWQKLNSTSMVQSQLTLFQNPQILRTISSGHDVIYTLAPFPVWGFIMTMVIVISFACKCKTALNDCAPELLTRIVQSPTKLNHKI